ncbi:MAG: hypothetical protein E6Q97_18590 [Desulfurellales bacterium]|nr:MAG: hypothetical protein E6Q97_18590 [Desulfurellales bacterium]
MPGSYDTSKRNQSRWMTAAFWEPTKGAGWYPVLVMPRNPRLDPCIAFAAYWDPPLSGVDGRQLRPGFFREGEAPGQPQNKEVVFFLNERFENATAAIDLANSDVNDMIDPDAFKPKH